MAVKKRSTNIVFLFILSVFLLVVAGGYYYVEERTGLLVVIYTALGVASLLICLVRLRTLTTKSTSTSWIKRAVLLSVLILLWTALYVMLNLIAFRHNARWDVTRARQHTLSDMTREIIGDLHQEIRLTAFHMGIPPKYLEDLFKEYKRVSNGKIKTEIIDPIVQIGYAAQFGNVISGNEKKIIVQSANEKREVDFTDKVLAEEELTNAIVRVTRKIRRVYFLIGHREFDIDEDADEGLKAFDALLGTNHVISKRLMLGIAGDIPDDCDVLIIAGPKDHISEDESRIISNYLKKGGDALFLIEHVLVTTPDDPLTEDELTKNPSLNNILNDWGINIKDDIVVDLSSHASGDVGSPATRNYLSHRSIVNDLDYTFFIRPRSISIVKDRRPTLQVAPIILTASEESSWGETNRTLQIKFDAGEDRVGPVPIAFAIWEPKEEGEGSDTRIIAITDADFLTNAYIGQYSNARLGINAINWLSEVNYKVIFDERDIKVERLDLTSKQKRVVVVILCMIPLLIATAGTVMWIRTRIS